MKLERPLTGAVLILLLLAPLPALADRVDVITPGGNASLAPPNSGGTEAAGTRPAEPETPRAEMASSSSARGDSDGEGGYEVDVQPSLQTRHFGGASLTCKVASSSTDLVVINESLEPLPPGTRIKWQLKTEGKRGYFAIINQLGGGESLVADGVLDGKARQDETCVARVI